MKKVDLITGFLGSGKTTFLIKYARHLIKQGLRIGILEYDYGAVNVDMLLLNKLRGANCEIEMVAAYRLVVYVFAPIIEAVVFFSPLAAGRRFEKFDLRRNRRSVFQQISC